MDRNDKVRKIAEVICAAEHGGQCLSHCDFSCKVECTNYAKALCDEGYRTIIWHKVEESTWKVIPRDMMLLFVVQYEDINTGEMIKQVIPGSIDSESNCLHLHCASFKDTPNNRNTEEIIAWTELPTYEE